MERIFTSASETQDFGRLLGQKLPGGTVLVLSGDLGTGKTTLTQGIGEGLGIKQLVKSPTYTLIREYDDGRIPLYHMDVYRLSDDTADLGLDEYFMSEGLVIVEWGELILEELPDEYLHLTLSYLDENRRKLTIVGHNFQLASLGLENK